ncbi:MAG TPA: hypothetical protein VG371_00720 [Solirubrobacteraceae bacterium]|nr:hypothetical protein [Solirubrobacteraceae bacterium]
MWDSWENWFIELGESHTTFPQLGFFRSPHPRNHWVLAAEAVLDGAALKPLIAVLGRMTDAPRSEWSSWSDDVPRHSPPLIRIHNH